MGGVGAAADSFAALAKAKPDFFLAIGDLSYDDIAPEKAWCNFVKKQLGDTYPFEVLVGNHEELPSSKSGFIDNFAKCLPDRLGEQGRYAHRYYFDYPADAPIARFIFIDPDLPRGEADAEYCRSGDKSNCNWLKERIDEAQRQGLWTIVSMHKVCVSAAEKPCEVGAELLNLLLERRVDLVLQGHEHGYQRTKQLSLGADCPELEPDVYTAGCVANDGSKGAFVRGAGPIFVVSAAFGQDPYPINLNDPELPYIATWMDDSNESKGWMEFTVTKDSIDGQFVGVTGPLTDTFTISGPAVTPADDAGGYGHDKAGRKGHTKADGKAARAEPTTGRNRRHRSHCRAQRRPSDRSGGRTGGASRWGAAVRQSSRFRRRCGGGAR